MYDIFFISNKESNCEVNWERLLEFHPNSQRIMNVQGINNAHLKCNELSKTDKFWTVDGDNWILESLPNDLYPVLEKYDLISFNSIDPITKQEFSSGGIKLWKKNKIINQDMSKGDFCLFATETRIMMQKTLSEHRYNSTPYETWRHSFRHMVKCLSGIIKKDVLQKNIDDYENRKELNQYSYRGYLDAKQYVEECGDNFEKINLINDYTWLELKAPKEM